MTTPADPHQQAETSAIFQVLNNPYVHAYAGTGLAPKHTEDCCGCAALREAEGLLALVASLTTANEQNEKIVVKRGQEIDRQMRRAEAAEAARVKAEPDRVQAQRLRSGAVS